MTESIFLVVAVSGRAIAQGLTSLGYSVAVIDGFADQDTKAAACVCRKVKRDRFGLDEDEVIKTVQTLSAEYTFSSLFYDSAIEVNPQLLEQIKINNVVGNSLNTLQRCRDPHEFFAALDKHSIAYPSIQFDFNVDDQSKWLVKHPNSTGGIGISANVDIENDQAYLQKHIEGVSFSITFLANGESITVLGVNTLWQQELGEAVPYAYAGAINQTKINNDVIATTASYAQTITKEFDLVGLNSMDCICDGNDVFVLEVNPRIPATYELYETKQGELMREHIMACEKRTLPDNKKAALLRAHAIVYAPDNIHIPSNMKWPLWTADRPHPGERISKYEPICNVFAGGQNYSQVCEMIATRKKTILKQLTL